MTINNDLKKVLIDEFGENVKFEHDLSDYTWLRVGGVADLFFSAPDEASLKKFLRILPSSIPRSVLGAGSNLLISDRGVRGAVIRLTAKGFGHIQVNDETSLMVGARVPDRILSDSAYKNGIGGFEFFAGIPGTLGGALQMNAGANGGETKELVERVFGLTASGNTISFSRDEMNFSYRLSNPNAEVLIFTRALMRGFLADQTDILQKINQVKAHREASQPINQKTCGSTFKNPLPKHSWRLINEAGLRDLRVGGAHLSEMHCNFMINNGDATASDFYELIAQIKTKVHEHSGYLLEEEVVMMGVWD